MARLLNVNSIYHHLNTVHPLPGASIIHLQGCRKGRTNPCPGCANEDLWSDEEKWLADPAELAEMIIHQAAASALSISGGEPLDQYKPLCTLLKRLKRVQFSILMWTGYGISHVIYDFGEVLEWLDYTVTGPYVEQKRVRNNPFISSSNQEIYCLNDRAQLHLPDFNHLREHEIVISKNTHDPVCLGCDFTISSRSQIAK
ncbi:MAG: 4Fe-4S cluster-binding domain-containing protein [Deltaproteobacteria bacterium]|nr:MAG: 4Fe-4S cluster-binding domain-containing protein [Deltaproteobacteria bacterium]